MSRSFMKITKFIPIHKNSKYKYFCLLFILLCTIATLMLVKSNIDFHVCKVSRIDYSRKTNRWSEYPVIPPNCKNKILIVSYHRSGSSFLGNLLQRNWPTFYVYEPLHYLGKYTYVREIQNKTLIKNSMNILNDLFKCEKLSQKINKSPVIWRPLLNDVTKTMPKALNIDKTNVSHAKFICDRSKNIVLKTVRIDMEYLETFYKNISYDSNKIKSVILFRDPRGIMSSRLSLPSDNGFCNTECRDVKLLCGQIRDNILNIYKLMNNSSELLNHLTFIRYEDLSLKSKLMAKKLYKKLDLNYTNDVEKWIQRNTHSNSGGPFKTSRNSSERVFAWIKSVHKINLDLNYIQKHCGDVMRILGYKIVSLEDIQTKNIKTKHLLKNDFPFKSFLL